jgi:hypothetical protein
MFDCSKEVIGFHNDEVTLPQAARDEMRDRRDANRRRVKKGLGQNNDAKPLEFYRQGSYAMKTMVQHPEKDYDIDDGVYFDKDDLKGAKGADKTALQARQMVRDAVDDGSFKTPPEARSNCVRVYYDAGYHVDMPVYRRVVTQNFWGGETVRYELASADWKRSDARDVTKWFDEENQRQSPDKENGRQLRRICRLIKKYSQSRASWRGSIAGGFMITKLVTECYSPDAAREDQSLYDTMKAIRDRLEWNLVVRHPVTPNDTITKGDKDPKARFLKEKLADALAQLAVLFTSDCTREDALKAWDKVFNTSYFTDQLEREKSAAQSLPVNGAPAVLTSGLLKSWEDDRARGAVNKKGGGHYA